MYSCDYVNVSKIYLCPYVEMQRKRVRRVYVPSWSPMRRKLGITLFKTFITTSYSGITFVTSVFFLIKKRIKKISVRKIRIVTYYQEVFYLMFYVTKSCCESAKFLVLLIL